MTNYGVSAKFCKNDFLNVFKKINLTIQYPAYSYSGIRSMERNLNQEETAPTILVHDWLHSISVFSPEFLNLLQSFAFCGFPSRVMVQKPTNNKKLESYF